MASLVKKLIKGRPYYYLVWSARVHGKPRTVRQVYIGPAEEVVARLSRQVEPQRAAEGSHAVVREFGGSAALWGIAQRLGVVDLIDAQVPSRSQQLSVGHYMVLTAINRCLAPASKRSMADWYAKSYMSQLLPARTKALESQRFWDAMDQLDETHLRKIEEQLLVRVRQQFELDVQRLMFDATNFFTFIDTQTPAQLPQRGHNKDKRDDLRQVSLAVLATLDFAVPLFHNCYAGNVSDPKEFDAVLEPMLERIRQLGGEPREVTLVFDKGNNSEENFKRVDHAQVGFVGSLPPKQHQDLLGVPLSQFRELKGGRLAGVLAYRTQKRVFGSVRTVVITWNPRLYAGQEAALQDYLQKKTAGLQAIQEKLERVRSRPGRGGNTTVASVQKEVNEMLRSKELRDCFVIDIGERDGLPVLKFSLDREALAALKERVYGKNILFTNRSEWPDEEIVLAYRSQYKLEDLFKRLKDPFTVSWWPLFHWTDQKIRVHAFYCVLGLLLLTLLQRQLAHIGIELPMPRMIKRLREIQDTTQVVRGDDGGIAVTTTLTKMDSEQQRIFNALDLGRFLREDHLGKTKSRRRNPHGTRN